MSAVGNISKCHRSATSEKIRFGDRDWWPQEFAVCMAMDAFRLCLFGRPKNFTKREIIAWMETVGEKHD